MPHITTTGLRLLVTILSLASWTLGDERSRGQRSDDSSPLTAVVSQLTQKVDQLTAQLAAQNTEIEQLKQRVGVTEQPIAFTALFRDSDQRNYGVGQTLKFDTVLYNTGSGYNPASGFFTAPSDGTYVFFVHVLHSHASTTTDAMEVDIYANNRILLRVGACCEDMNSGSNLVTVHLTRGQTIHVQVSMGSMFWGGVHTSFSGYRLTPL